MSHRSLAAIWVRLELRTDIDNILYELIGQHNLELSTLHVASDGLRRSSIELAVCLKVIFDLQRTYRQSGPVRDRCAYLLRSSTLSAAVLHLLHIKATVFPSSENILGIDLPEQSFLAQALVSGLRALLLRNCVLSLTQQSHFRAAYKRAWTLIYPLGPLDDFIIQKLCPALIEQLCRGPGELATIACGEIEHRDYASGLYPLESRPGELLEPARNAALNIDKADWLKPFCILFDILWVTEAALIQLCANQTKPANSTRQDQPTQQEISRLISTRGTVLKEACNRRSGKLDAIMEILFAPCTRDCCSCLQVSYTTPDLPTLSPVNSRSSDFSSDIAQHRMTQILERSLTNFATRLTTRRDELWNSNGELSDLSDDFDQWMEKWYVSPAEIRRGDENTRLVRRRAYVLSCPELHPVPYDILRGLVESSDGQPGLQDLENGSSLIRVSIQCNECDLPCDVKSARLIEPLRDLSMNLTESLRRRAPKQLEAEPEVPVHDNGSRLSLESYRNNSSISQGSDSPSSSQKCQMRKKGHLKDLVGEFANDSRSRSVPLYTFSTDGRTLLLWYQRKRSITVYDVNTQRTQIFNTEPILRATSGAKLYATLSSHGADWRLHVYEASDGRLVCQPHLVKVPVSCIAFSRNDKFVALGSESAVLIFDVDNRTMHRHKLPHPDTDTLDSQRIAFSLDNTKFIVVTRYKEKGEVRSYISECTTNTMCRQKVPRFKIPTGRSNDSGLSSVLMDLDAGFVCITAFTSQSATAIVSLETQAIHYFKRENLDSQIQCAIQTSSGFRLFLVNVRNQVFTVQRQADGVWQVVEKVTPWPEKSWSSGTDRMVIATPDEDTIHLFGLHEKEWRLMVI